MLSSLLILLPLLPLLSSSQLPDNRAIYSFLTVDPSGRANFTTIQSAIDFIPSHNSRWTCIHIKEGIYREQVMILSTKPFVYIKGEGRDKTFIIWGAHGSIATSATFTSLADNTIAESITFMNSYNSPAIRNPHIPAVAAKIAGDMSAFLDCGFLGFQDTLWDVQGRHYFKYCTIQGAIDFIFGAGQSLYEGCTVSVIVGELKGVAGYITAQARTSYQEESGFVFKNCNVMGNGKTFLGRAWRDHATVLFYNTSMADIVVPQGWNAWLSVGKEYKLTFAEYNCRGLGSDTSGRVKWEKKLSEETVNQLTSFSYIDKEGWLNRLAIDILSG